jgi:hypothetical protein
VEVVAAGVADDDVWAPTERPDKIATAEVDKAKSKNMSKDVAFPCAGGLSPKLSQLSTPPSAPPRTNSPSTRWVWLGKKPVRDPSPTASASQNTLSLTMLISFSLSLLLVTWPS